MDEGVVGGLVKVGIQVKERDPFGEVVRTFRTSSPYTSVMRCLT